MRRMPLAPMAPLLAATVLSGATVLSIHRVNVAVEAETAPASEEEAPPPAQVRREAALAVPLLVFAHHNVHAYVGEEVWEKTIKPEFLGWVLRRVVADTGNPFPDASDVTTWLRKNEEEATRALHEIVRRHLPEGGAKQGRVGWREL